LDRLWLQEVINHVPFHQYHVITIVLDWLDYFLFEKYASLFYSFTVLFQSSYSFSNCFVLLTVSIGRTKSSIFLRSSSYNGVKDNDSPNVSSVSFRMHPDPSVAYTNNTPGAILA